MHAFLQKYGICVAYARLMTVGSETVTVAVDTRNLIAVVVMIWKMGSITIMITRVELKKILSQVRGPGVG